MTAPDQCQEQDYYAWALASARLIREGRFSEIDLQQVAEELEEMGKRDRSEMESRLAILIAHLLKWRFQFEEMQGRYPDWSAGSWRGPIREQRFRIEKQLAMSPSLRAYLPEAVERAYSDAVDIAADETELPRSTFPTTCPYTVEQLLDKGFYPVGTS